MGLLKRVFSIAVGVGAGALAYKLLKEYDRQQTIEAEFTQQPQACEDAAQPSCTQEPQPEQPAPIYPQRPDRGPNVNPVSLGTLEKPIDEATGKLDATRIASPEDFGDWDEWGCQG